MKGGRRNNKGRNEDNESQSTANDLQDFMDMKGGRRNNKDRNNKGRNDEDGDDEDRDDEDDDENDENNEPQSTANDLPDFMDMDGGTESFELIEY